MGDDPNDKLFDALVQLSIQLIEYEKAIDQAMLTRLRRVQDRLAGIIDRYPSQLAILHIEGEISWQLMGVVEDLQGILNNSRSSVIRSQIDTIESLLNEVDANGDSLLFALLGALAINGLTRPDPQRVLDDTRLALGSTVPDVLRRLATSSSIAVRRSVQQVLLDATTAFPDTPDVSIQASERTIKRKLNKTIQEALTGQQWGSMRTYSGAVVGDVLNSTFNTGLAAIVQQNPQVFQGSWLWSAILDTRVCLRCLSLHGQLTTEIAPLHPRCRCLNIPLIVGQPVPDMTEFEGWFRRQSEDYKRRILGSRYSDYVSGRLNIRNYANLRRSIL